MFGATLFRHVIITNLFENDFLAFEFMTTRFSIVSSTKEKNQHVFLFSSLSEWKPKILGGKLALFHFFFCVSFERISNFVPFFRCIEGAIQSN